MNNYDEGEEKLSLVEVLWLYFQNDEAAIDVAEFIEKYALSTVGNNQLPSIVFLPDKGGVFGSVDTWNMQDAEEVM